MSIYTGKLADPMRFDCHHRMEIYRNDGITKVDVSDFVQKVMIDAGKISGIGAGKTGADGAVRTMDFMLGGDRFNKFSPKQQNSFWNLVNDQFDPVLQEEREIKFYIALKDPGIQPIEDDWVLLFHGYLGDNINTDEDGIITGLCRDLSARLQTALIEEEKEYGSADGVPAETVIQQLLNDNLGAGVVNLFCPEPTGFLVRTYQQKRENLLNATQTIASQFGWYLGYKYDPVTKSFRYTLMNPPRNKDINTADFLLDYRYDIYKQDLKISSDHIRNKIIVYFTNRNTGLREKVEVTDPDIGQRWTRTAIFEESATSFIDTPEEALNFANLALHDLKDKTGTTNINCPIIPEMDVFMGLVVDNPRISSTQDFYAVQSFRHNFTFDKSLSCRTEIIASGKVVGGKINWLRKTSAPGSPGDTINPEKIDKTPPAQPIWGSNEPSKDFVVTKSGNSIPRVEIYWARSTETDISQYFIERALVESGQVGEFNLIGTAPKESSSYMDTTALEDGKTYAYRVMVKDIANNPSPYSTEKQVTIDQVPPKPGGTLSINLTPLTNAIQVEITHSNVTGKVDGYEVFASTTTPVEAISNNLKSQGMTYIHQFPATAGGKYYVAVRAYNSGGSSSLIQVGPVTASLMPRSDLDASIFNAKMYKEYRDGQIEEVQNVIAAIIFNEANLSTSWNIPRNEDKIIIEYPGEQYFNSLLSKTANHDISSIQISSDGKSWISTSYQVETLSDNVKRYIFDAPHFARYFKIDYSLPDITSTVEVYLLRPNVLVPADYGLFGRIDAGMVNISSGDPDGERIVTTGAGREHFALGTDGKVRKCLQETLQGRQIWYNKDTGNNTDGNGNLIGDFVWEITPQGEMKDKEGYAVIDINGFDGKTIAQELIDTQNDIEFQAGKKEYIIRKTITIPAGKRWMFTVSPKGELRINTDDTEKCLWYLDNNIYGEFELKDGSRKLTLSSGVYHVEKLIVHCNIHFGWEHITTGGNNFDMSTPIGVEWVIREFQDFLSNDWTLPGVNY